MTKRPTRRPAGTTSPAPRYGTGIASQFINRELSWLDFNERVLSLAASEKLPLLERFKFLAISASNLDEFYQVRVAGLHDQIAAELESKSLDGLTPRKQRNAVSARVQSFVAAQERLLHRQIGRAHV